MSDAFCDEQIHRMQSPTVTLHQATWSHDHQHGHMTTTNSHLMI